VLLNADNGINNDDTGFKACLFFGYYTSLDIILCNVNGPTLMLFVDVGGATLSSSPPRRLILCRIWSKMHVLRDDPKWAVNRTDFADNFYPPYCSGIAWVFTTDIVQALYRVSSRVKFFWVDDVYITGILPARSVAGELA